MFKVATLYKFVPLNNLVTLQEQLQVICKSLTGTLLIASEGINGTIAGMPDVLDAAIAQIEALPSFSDLWYQYSKTSHKPFRRLKIRIKKEIITMDKHDFAFIQTRALHVLAVDWNSTLERAAIVLDVRNDYEYRLGSFKDALNPKINYFAQFPSFVDNHLTDYKDQPIAMFCTGGIRCEKASAYMLARGFKELYQLTGGILQYLAHIEQELSKWEGECFVFDERISLNHGLKKGEALLCYGCRMPLTSQDIDQHYKHNVQCKFCLKSEQI